MEYRRFGDKIMVRIDRGEEILEQVKELARRENITLASVTALGATNEFNGGRLQGGGAAVLRKRVPRQF